MKYFVIFLLFITFVPSIFAQSLLLNEGFENGSEGWATNSSKVTFTISDAHKYEGDVSAYITSTSTRSYGIEQVVKSIAPETDYMVTGYTRLDADDGAKAFIRIAWYKSTDGSGSQMSTEDSEAVTAKDQWKKIEMQTKSPEGAHSAEIRLIVVNGSAYFDNVDMQYAEIKVPSPTATAQPTATVVPTPTSTMISNDQAKKILISEVYPAPNTGESEWVELHNTNDEKIKLQDWYIDDVEDGGASPKLFTATIQANGYETVEFIGSILNNGGDSVRLLRPDKTEVQSMTYTDSKKGFSWGLHSSGEYCLQEPSKEAANAECINDGDETDDNDSEENKDTVGNQADTPQSSSSKKTTNNQTDTSDKSSRNHKNYFSLLNRQNVTTNETDGIVLGTSELTFPASSETNIVNMLSILAVSYCTLSIISIISKMYFFQYT